MAELVDAVDSKLNTKNQTNDYELQKLPLKIGVVFAFFVSA